MLLHAQALAAATTSSVVPRQLKYASELLQACRTLFTGLDTPLLHFTDFLLQVGLQGCGLCKAGELGGRGSCGRCLHAMGVVQLMHRHRYYSHAAAITCWRWVLLSPRQVSSRVHVIMNSHNLVLCITPCAGAAAQVAHADSAAQATLPEQPVPGRSTRSLPYTCK